MRYQEKRFAAAIPYFLLAAVAFVFFGVLFRGDLPPIVRKCLLLATPIGGTAAFVWGCRRIRDPRCVLEIDDQSVRVIGLEPAALAPFQLWTSATIPKSEMVEIEIGNIGAALSRGKWQFLFLDASRNAMYQNVCVFHYLRKGIRQTIYYPHTNNIEGFETAVSEMQKVFGDQVKFL